MNTYELRCEICDTMVVVENYGDGTCLECGAKYTYDEGSRLTLTPQQLAVLRAFAESYGPEIACDNGGCPICHPDYPEAP